MGSLIAHEERMKKFLKDHLKKHFKLELKFQNVYQNKKVQVFILNMVDEVDSFFQCSHGRLSQRTQGRGSRIMDGGQYGKGRQHGHGIPFYKSLYLCII